MMQAPDGSKLPRRFWRKVTASVDTGCWIWNASTRHGYGQYHWSQIGGRDGKQVVRLAHIVSWEDANGPVPDGLELDHRCRTTSCVNPEHLEPVTHAENMARGKQATATHCHAGHEFTDENTYRHPTRGTRDCRACARERDSRRRPRRK